MMEMRIHQIFGMVEVQRLLVAELQVSHLNPKTYSGYFLLRASARTPLQPAGPFGFAQGRLPAR
jgi:hypothetical protein